MAAQYLACLHDIIACLSPALGIPCASNAQVFSYLWSKSRCFLAVCRHDDGCAVPGMPV